MKQSNFIGYYFKPGLAKEPPFKPFFVLYWVGDFCENFNLKSY